MSERYDHKKIEKKWQQRWEDSNAFSAQEDSTKQKAYILDMFPYPSGAGLHVGHVEGYTATDIYSRFKRMQGFNVLHPMGWDAFGLPAENYAIKTGVPPITTTAESIDMFRAQIKRLGLSYDWSRELGTHTPEYYKWTQWFFLFLYKNGLAEKRMAKVNWCPKDQTVLANEQTVSESGEKGVCVRCGTPVVQKDLAQWFFKITEFSDALVDDLDQVDWPESTKINQRNWIGRSEGALIEFALAAGEKIQVFTTRPDTLFGATYLVLAPEHSLVESLAQKATNKDEILAYVAAAKNKTELDRQEGAKDKTGVEIQGVKAINPANQEGIPVFIADYVLGGYGTGAIMAVPAHDERDFAFAKKFNVPVKYVVMPVRIDEKNPPVPEQKSVFRKIVMALVRDPKTGKYLALKRKDNNWTTFVIGGVEENEDPLEAALREIKEETGYTNPTLVRALGGPVYSEFNASHKGENRIAHNQTFLFELNDTASEPLAPEEAAKHEVVWLDPSEITRDRMAHGELDIVLERLNTGNDLYIGAGILTNSGEFDGMESEEAKKKITEFVGGTLTKTYKLRDWLVSRQRYWGAPIPVVYDPDGVAHPVPEEHLPWLLPTDVEFRPTGVSPLALSKELKERTEKLFGVGWTPEVDTMDTFVCSSWYYFRFADQKNTTDFASKEAIKKWLPVDLYMGGAEHTVLHLMYARFFTKALKKFGYVDFDEPFLKLRHQGTILAEDGSKMSKSKGNVINPDEFIELYGADTVRLYEMFMGPLEAMKPWNTNNILGVRRFLERVWKLEVGNTVLDQKQEALVQQTIKKVGDDIEGLKFNTAISSLMILLNALEGGALPKEAYKVLVQLLAPLAPHTASELWEKAGFEGDVVSQSWPAYDPSKLAASVVTVAVQINGKVRGSVELSADATKAEALVAARANPAVAKWLTGGEEKKAIYIKGKIINFVIAQG